MKPSIHFRVASQTKARLRERCEALRDEIGISVDLSEYMRQRADRIAANPRLHERAEQLFAVCELIVKHQELDEESLEILERLVQKIKGEKQ